MSQTENVPILSEKTPTVDYRKRYDQVSWRSADTDFETEPTSIANGDIQVRRGKCISFCTKRNRKLSALIIVVIIFVIIMVALIYLYYSKPGVINSTAEVATDCGQVTGLIVERQYLGDVIELNVFKGIPYAVPPLGNLRWSAPISLSENRSNCWKGVLGAYKFGQKCAQGRYEGSEDCLYLNVYTPKLSVNDNLPVLLWIHGGYLMEGSGDSLLHSPNMEFAIRMNAVVVTVNYRLNAFGFLTLKELWQNNASYANYGLMDQILALKWIQKNIQNFGGNADSVTVCGHNAGGSSVFALLVSPLADGLFHKVISMSGFPKIDMSYKSAARQNRAFVNRTRCGNLSTSAIRECLYSLSTQQILNAIPYFSTIHNPYWPYIKKNLLDFPYKGSIDGGLIVVDPLVVVKPPSELSELSTKVKGPISVLVGSMAQEIGVSPLFTFDGSNQQANYTNYLKNRLSEFSSNFTNIVLDQLYSNETTKKDVPSDSRTEYLHETITSDVRVTCPTNSLSRALSKSSKHRVFRYVVTHAPNAPITLFKYPAKFSFHMWDKITLFNFDVIQEKYKPNPADLRFQASLQENFKHFILFGHMENSDWNTGATGLFTQDGSIKVLPGEYQETQCKFWNSPSNGFVPYAWSD